MGRRFICLMGCLLIGGVACSAQQKVPTVAPLPASSPIFEPVNSPEMDALANKLAMKITDGRITSVVIVGGAGPENKVSALGASLRDGLNDALVRQAAGFRVITTADVGDTLKRNRVSTGIIYCNLVADWIAAYTQTEVAVVLELERLENGHALVKAKIWDEREKNPSDKRASGAGVPYAEFAEEIALTDSQISSQTIQYVAPLSVPVAIAGKGGISMPICVACPGPGRIEKPPGIIVHGTIHASATVLPNGTPIDIMIDRPIGFGFDRIAINTLLVWKFKPAVDGNKQPVATRVPIEMAFQLY